MNPTQFSAFVEALGWMLVHFLWQGAVVAAVLWCALKVTRNLSPQVRYAAGCVAMLVMCVGAAATFAWQLQVAQIPAMTHVEVVNVEVGVPPVVVGSTKAAPVASSPLDAVLISASEPAATTGLAKSRRTIDFEQISSRLRPWLPWVVGFWMAGVGWLSLRLLAGWTTIRRLRISGNEFHDGEIVQRFRQLCERMKVSRPVQLLGAASTTVPMVVGWLKPVVLIPAGLLTNLTPSQVEAVLAHELAHIRRHDYLVNLVQNVIETLFFFHPVVWWVSNQIRAEREHCCDDVASDICGGTLDYARALAALEELRYSEVTLSVAASGGSLLTRIRRLAGVNPTKPRGGWPAATLVVVCILFASLLILNRPTQGEQDRSDKAETDASDEPDPATVNPAKSSLTLTVMDAKTREMIPDFQVVAGTKTGMFAPSTEPGKQGAEIAGWQSHMVRKGQDGILFWPLDRAYDVMMLRVTAAGYQPQLSGWVKKAGGAKSLAFLMVKDPGVKGQVLQPDGKPAAGALIGRAIAMQGIQLENGTLADFGKPVPEGERTRNGHSTMVKADDQGRFEFPTEVDPSAAVLIVHDSGVAEISNLEFQKSPNVTLKRWGRVEGKVLWKDKPGVNEQVDLSLSRDDFYPGTISFTASTRTDAEGKFVFEKIPPGRVQISRPIVSEGGGWSIFDGLYRHVDVRPGEATPVLIGGQGRKVVGRMTNRKVWDKVTFHFHPNAPHIGFPGDNEQWKAFGEFKLSPIGPLFFRDKLKPNADGTFEIPHMLPGKYQLFAIEPGAKSYILTDVIKIEPEEIGVASQPLDLGEINLADPEPEKENKTEATPVDPKPDEDKPDAKESEKLKFKISSKWVTAVNLQQQVDLVAAQHVLLWDGKIVTWDEVVSRLREMRKAGVIHLSLHATRGSVSTSAWQDYHDKLMSVYREFFQPAGLTFTSVLPRYSLKLDEIKTAADLVPNPARARPGKVVTADGTPVYGAQVVVLPVDGVYAALPLELDGSRTLGNAGKTNGQISTFEYSYDIDKRVSQNPSDRDWLNITRVGADFLIHFGASNGRLLHPLHEEWSPTDKSGNFVIHPRDDDYLIAILHPWGFVMRKGPVAGENPTITLEPWAEMTLAPEGRVVEQTVTLKVRPAGTPAESPFVQIGEVKTKGNRLILSVPAGQVDSQRTLTLEGGETTSVPTQRINVKPGQAFFFDHPEWNEEEARKKLDEIHKERRLGEPKDGDFDKKEEPKATPPEEAAPAKEKKASQKEQQPENDQSTFGKASDKPAPDTVTVSGKVLDAETGERVGAFVIEGGLFKLEDPAKVSWGYSVSRGSETDGTFSTTINWSAGWTARVVADGYEPKPILTEAPPAGAKTIDVVIRLKRGRLIRGQVLDHRDQPVKGAAVFAIGPISRNFAGGKAIQDYGDETSEDKSAAPVLTDVDGRFELLAGETRVIGVSCQNLDAWAISMPKEGDAVIKLPEPARVEIEYNIEGGDADAKIFYQFLSHLTPPGFHGVQSTRAVPIKNGGKLVLAALPPGQYQFYRRGVNKLGEVQTWPMLERQFLNLKPGETRKIRYVREKGARVKGRVTWPAEKEYSGVAISIKSVNAGDDKLPGGTSGADPVLYASCTTAKDGTYLTERIPPGRYRLTAEGYSPLNEIQRRTTIPIHPSYIAEDVIIDVPESGEVTVPEIRFTPSAK